MPAFASVDAPFERVRRIAVLRGGGLGDLLFAMPAIDALAATYPGAEILLLGSPVHAAFLEGRPSSVARVEVLPVARGVRDVPGEEPDAVQAAEFRARVRRLGPIDLGVQLHGGGRHSNPFLLGLGPRHTVGSATPDAARLERTLPYAYYQHEVVRGLEVAGLAGAEPVTLEPRISVTAAERRAVAQHLPPDDAPLAVVHAGASDPRRRWPTERFVSVIEGLLDAGASVRLIGDAGDRPLASSIARRVEAGRPGNSSRMSVVAGSLSLGESAALLAAADVVVANDSGPRHLAQAVGAATVGVFWFGNVVNAAPFSRGRHRVHLAFTVTCPVCGIDVTQVGWTAERCEHDVSFVSDVEAPPVLVDALQLMATNSPRSDSPGAHGSRNRQAG
ncbi:glycosyltransferase family 9 protein [Agromyces albus]|uniref:glycosyltransferase family 9 protein n=1 Tax=Agromyces albus TaxID=205332 RepID=UPI002784A97D|nr:glycosyltransferase family 9 protein [Agromyces albus]MDQ0575572.1 ADP-heptose:LPS heptosyltransferase [Agromyces albus]